MPSPTGSGPRGALPIRASLRRAVAKLRLSSLVKGFVRDIFREARVIFALLEQVFCVIKAGSSGGRQNLNALTGEEMTAHAGGYDGFTAECSQANSECEDGA
jgi:hypothetical protein